MARRSVRRRVRRACSLPFYLACEVLADHNSYDDASRLIDRVTVAARLDNNPRPFSSGMWLSTTGSQKRPAADFRPTPRLPAARPLKFCDLCIGQRYDWLNQDVAWVIKLRKAEFIGCVTACELQNYISHTI